ncbi:MAG: hypothetical protein KA140_07840 [Caldisericia bacterium]|nr:hypothetical protein [Caldisericia bacterium]
MDIEQKEVIVKPGEKYGIIENLKTYGWALKQERETQEERFENKISSDGKQSSERIVETKLHLIFARRIDNPHIAQIKMYEIQHAAMIADLNARKKQLKDLSDKITSMENSIVSLEAGYNPKGAMVTYTVITSIILFVAGIFIFRAVHLPWWWSFVSTAVMTVLWLLFYKTSILPKTSDPKYIEMRSAQMKEQAEKQKASLVTERAARDLMAQKVQSFEREVAGIPYKITEMMEGYWL